MIAFGSKKMAESFVEFSKVRYSNVNIIFECILLIIAKKYVKFLA